VSIEWYISIYGLAGTVLVGISSIAAAVLTAGGTPGIIFALTLVTPIDVSDVAIVAIAICTIAIHTGWNTTWAVGFVKVIPVAFASCYFEVFVATVDGGRAVRHIACMALVTNRKTVVAIYVAVIVKVTV
jgi:hypothetical protein